MYRLTVPKALRQTKLLLDQTQLLSDVGATWNWNKQMRKEKVLTEVYNTDYTPKIWVKEFTISKQLVNPYLR